MNNKTTFTWSSRDGSRRSLLDLFLVTADLALEFNWDRIEEKYDSDHRPTLIFSAFEFERYQNKSKVYD